MTKYKAVGIYEDSIFELRTDSVNPQQISEEISNLNDHRIPDSILLLENGGTSFGNGGVNPPYVVHRFVSGRDYNEHVVSLDGAADIIKSWLENLDDPKRIADMLKDMTGAVNVRIIGEGVDAKIGYDLP